LRVAHSSAFNVGVSLCILINTIVLALDTHPIEVGMEKAIEIANLVFYFIFLAEMFIKLMGLGFRSYFKDSYNIFDFLIVLLSTIDVLLNVYVNLTMTDECLLEKLKQQGGPADSLAVSQVFRVFRLLRIFKLARSWPTFNYFLVTIGGALTKITSFSALLFLFIFMFVIFGMDLFSNKLRFNYHN